MRNTILRFRGLLIALVVLALSTSFAFAAQTHPAGSVRAATLEDSQGSDETAGDEDKNENEATDETADDPAGDGGDNCLTDPTTLTPEQLAAMSHGSIVCWAAHQDTPAGYANHGAWVSHWAHMGKDNATKTKGKSAEHAPTR